MSNTENINGSGEPKKRSLSDALDDGTRNDDRNEEALREIREGEQAQENDFEPEYSQNEGPTGMSYKQSSVFSNNIKNKIKGAKDRFSSFIPKNDKDNKGHSNKFFKGFGIIFATIICLCVYLSPNVEEIGQRRAEKKALAEKEKVVWQAPDADRAVKELEDKQIEDGMSENSSVNTEDGQYPQNDNGTVPPDAEQRYSAYLQTTGGKDIANQMGDKQGGGAIGRLTPDGKLAISKLPDTPKNSKQGNSPRSGGNNSRKSLYASEKVKELYNTYRATFLEALKSNPKISSDGNKSGIDGSNGNSLLGDSQSQTNKLHELIKAYSLSGGDIASGQGQQQLLQLLQQQQDKNNSGSGSTNNELFIAREAQQNATIKDEYLQHTRRKPVTKLELKAGTVINAVLINGINSDLPGTVIGQITENVYDTVTGYYLLIPQGAKMIGSYSSHIMFGQKRVLVVWKRILYPDGSSLNIGGLTGADQAGYSGFKQKVDNHYGRLFSAALFTSIFVWAGKEATKNDTDYYGRNSKAAEAVMEQIASLGAKVAERNLNISPTLIIKPGYRYTIVTTKDIAFAEDYIIGQR